MEENKPDLKSELEHHYEFSYPFPPRYHDWYWSDANMTYDEALVAFHAQTEQEQRLKRNPVNRDRLKKPVGSSPDDKGYPFPPRHSMAWENNDYGISYDEAVALYEHEKAKWANIKLTTPHPLILVTPQTPKGSEISFASSRHSIFTGHPLQTAFALASLFSLSSFFSKVAGGKNKLLLCCRQRASYCQVEIFI